MMSQKYIIEMLLHSRIKCYWMTLQITLHFNCYHFISLKETNENIEWRRKLLCISIVIILFHWIRKMINYICFKILNFIGLYTSKEHGNSWSLIDSQVILWYLKIRHLYGFTLFEIWALLSYSMGLKCFHVVRADGMYNNNYGSHQR